MGKPHLHVFSVHAVAGPDGFIVPFIFEGEDILVAFYQTESEFGFYEFASAFLRIFPSAFMHVELHQYGISQSLGETSVVLRAVFISRLQIRDGGKQVIFDEFRCLLRCGTRYRGSAGRIVQKFFRRELDGPEHIVKDICKPASSATDLGHVPVLAFLFYIHRVQCTEDIRHSGNVPDVVVVNYHRALLFLCTEVDVYDVVPIAVGPPAGTDIRSHVTEDMYSIVG